MRHFAGILLGIVLVPVFFALNWLVSYLTDRLGFDGSGWPLLALLLAYVLVGLVVAVFVASRSISPMALLVGGLLIAVAEVLLFLPLLARVKVNLPMLYDYPEITDGYLLVAVAAALLFAGFFPTRWHRKRPRDEEDEYAGVLTPADADDEPRRDGAYDASWGSGRNEYAEEPEAPYVSRAQDTSTQQVPVTQPGEYDRPPSSQVGEYDQQALGYGYEDADTAQYRQPPTIHDPVRQHRAHVVDAEPAHLATSRS